MIVLLELNLIGVVLYPLDLNEKNQALMQRPFRNTATFLKAVTSPSYQDLGCQRLAEKLESDDCVIVAYANVDGQR